jgi:phosphoribosylglycinamide formyltransferase 1
MNNPRVLVLISGRGSNLAALARMLDSAAAPGQLVGVVGNRADAAGLHWAREHRLPTQLVDHQAFESREAFDQALLQACESCRPDLVVLAGFMRVIKEPLLRAFPWRIINLHPSLLPKFPGLDGIGQTWRSGEPEGGCTVHWVTEVVDGGSILGQARVSRLPDDTEAAFAERIHAAEHRLLPEVVARLSESALP